MPTFDIVSKYEIYEIENTVNIVKRDILNRYDFKGSNTSIKLDKKNSTIKLESIPPDKNTPTGTSDINLLLTAESNILISSVFIKFLFKYKSSFFGKLYHLLILKLSSSKIAKLPLGIFFAFL